MNIKYENLLTCIKGSNFYFFLCFLFVGCSYLKEEACKNTTELYKGIAFNIVLLEKPVRNMDYYDLKAKDLLKNRDTLIRIYKMLTVFPQLSTPGDTLVKELGTTRVELRLQDSVFDSRVFVTEWTCDKGYLTNGLSEADWRARLNAAGYP